MAYASWSVVFGEQPSQAKWNILGTNDAHFYSFLGDNLAYQSWVPTWTNLSGGTTTYAKYTTIGNTIFFRLKYTLAGAGVAGIVRFSTPAAMHGDISTASDAIDAQVLFNDATGSIFTGICRRTGASELSVYPLDVATYVNTDNTSSTVPFTWANADTISVAGNFEKA